MVFYKLVCYFAVVSFLNLDLPFNDTLDWTRFSIIGRTKDVHLNGEKLNKLLEVKKCPNFFAH